MHTDYDHFYIPVTSKKGKFQPKTNIFPGNNMGKIMVPKCEHLMLLRGISRYFTSDIDFTDEAVVQCDSPVVKILV